MKNFRVIRCQVLLISLIAATDNVSPVFAQSTVPIPKGYWTVEANTKNPNGSIVRFYTVDSKLIYQEFLKKLSLDVNRPKIVVLLNAALDEAMINFELSQTVVTSGNIVADLKKRGVDEQLYAGRKN